MTFDARHPETPQGLARTGLLSGSRLGTDTLSKLGEIFASTVYRLQEQLVPDAAGRVQPAQWLSVRAELARLERLGVQIQEIARVLAGEGTWVTERVDLAAAARQALSMWSAEAGRSGAVLAGPNEPFEVDVNPAIVDQLLNLGLEYALHIGRSVEVGCGTEGHPPRPVLSFEIHLAQTPAVGAEDDGLNDLPWLLFTTLARASGLMPQRLSDGRWMRLTLTLAAGESLARSQPTAALLPKTHVAAGRRVLLLEPQESSRVQSHLLLNAVGMAVDATATIEQARAALASSPQTHLPDVLLTGLPVNDPSCAALIESVRARQPRLRVVELVDDDSAFAFSVPGSDLPARVGRHTLARTLVAAVSQELDTV